LSFHIEEVNIFQKELENGKFMVLATSKTL